MILLAVLLCCLALVVWNVTSWPAVRPRFDSTAETSVSVLIPARDEEANLAACLETVLSQRFVDEVLIYDDDSSDSTASIAAAYSRIDPRVQMIESVPLPAGWCGKNFACAQLAGAARCEWLLFLDADSRLAPGAVSGIVSAAISRRVSFLSCWPAFSMVTLGEKLLMPMLNFVVFTMYPAPLGVRRQDPSLGLAHGACILVLKAAYRRIGGHSAVASAVFEDTKLARLWRERGERGLCLDGQHVVTVRMYGSFQQIWAGFQKNFRSAFETSFAFWMFLLFHVFVFLAPFALGLRFAALVIAARLLLAVRFRQPLWSAILHPFAECFLLALGVSSWWRWRSHGSGVTWKGRVYKRA